MRSASDACKESKINIKNNLKAVAKLIIFAPALQRNKHTEKYNAG